MLDFIIFLIKDKCILRWESIMERDDKVWPWTLGHKVPVIITLEGDYKTIAYVAAFDPKQSPQGKRGLFLDAHVIHVPIADWDSQGLIIMPQDHKSSRAEVKTLDGKNITEYIRQGFGGFG